MTQDYYVEKFGQGDPILFLPAAGFSGNEGFKIAEHLSDRFETHMIDLPGFGKSKGIETKVSSIKLANWVKDYLDEQHIEKANLIGHSLGGAILLNFAVHYPDKVNKLVLLDQGHKPFPRVPKSEFGAFAYFFPLLNMLVNLFGKSFLNKLAPLFTQDGEQKVDNDEIRKQFCKQASIEEDDYVRLAFENRADFSVEALNLLFGYYKLNLPNLLKKVTVPTYLVYGTFEGLNEKEYINTKRQVEKLHKHNLPITFQPLKGGHYVHWNQNFAWDELERFLLKNSEVSFVV
ncbi:alpha/beta hydrolase [Ornithinibacillus halophilus]|uniref:Pimeloyl-ACP methyl ester carboxylesterase n=1 Tax=Ornithinibacillus halophilus TaxID=930117 RepID=A0A1M5GQG0_9BACI|nr:alpha/beta hydrolase [Ornithinibacillus halophilus]SHG06050.1 Pimeloyl-ACP methyl ester carboxylesterase [Ornithinibacillus halophilus]